MPEQPTSRRWLAGCSSRSAERVKTFRAWAQRTASAHGYRVRYLPVGVEDPEVGPPTQLAVFTRVAV